MTKEKLDSIIKVAKKKYPLGAWLYNVFLTEEDILYLEHKCDVNAHSVYMSGKGTYRVTYKK